MFLLEYVEHFLIKEPLSDFRVPIDVENWFDASKVQSKRAEIAEVILKKTTEWRQGDTPPMPALKFFDDAIIIDSDNNNDANVVDKMDEDGAETIPGEHPVDEKVLIPVIEPIISTIEENFQIPSQSEIAKNYELQPDSSTKQQPEEYLLTYQDVYDDPEGKSDSANSSGVDPLMTNGDMDLQSDDVIVISE